MKYSLSFLLFFAFKMALGQGTSLTDGPYVFYGNKPPVVKMIENGKVDSLSKLASLSVRFDHPNLDFRVTLKKAIEIEPAIFSAPEKLFVVSDIEGEFDAFRNLLFANKVIDGNYNWTFGKGHLVICGDLFDRGKHVTEYLWLLYILEEKAKAAGGYVHVILGNHDIMNLSGDFRYVQPKYFEAAKLMGLDYAALFGENTELGRWLRSKNIIEKIGSLLFLHGGISPEVLSLKTPITELNNLCRPYYANGMALVPHNLKALLGDGSPFWYRGYFIEPRASQNLVDSTLAFYCCDRIIVGHTVIDHIGMSYQGKVIGVDLDHHKNVHEALLIDRGRYYRVDDQGNKTELLTH